MPHSTRDAHVRLDTRPAHPSAVTASLTGARHRTAPGPPRRVAASSPSTNTPWSWPGSTTKMPYWADQATQALNAEGINHRDHPGQLEANTEEWTWANYPMPWCTRAEIREVSNEAPEDLRRHPPRTAHHPRPRRRRLAHRCRRHLPRQRRLRCGPRRPRNLAEDFLTENSDWETYTSFPIGSAC